VVTAGSAPAPDRLDLLFDLGGAGLLAAFIGLLLAGSLWTIPAFTYIATAFLLAAFGVVCGANRRQDLHGGPGTHPADP